MIGFAPVVKRPCHRFWRDEIGFVEAARPFAAQLVGHQQITDAYLLGLAVHKTRKATGAAMIERGMVEIL
jgi:hypothetical protein